MEKSKPKINFNPDLFNNVYWHLEQAIHDSNIRYIWLYGGSSASKTYSVVQLTIKEMLGSNNYNTMVMRKVSNDIRDSIFQDFKNIINEWGLNELFTIQQNYILCTTGSYVRFRGLDDSEKVKGISNFKKVILEEVNQFDEEDFKQIRKRLRGLPGQQVISIFNPIVESHWIKTNVFDADEWVDNLWLPSFGQKSNCPGQLTDSPISGKKLNAKGNSLILKTNYLDNRYIVGPNYIDQHVIDDYEWDKQHDYGKYEVYALGEWGKIVTGGEFYKNFKREFHVKPTKYDPNLMLDVSLDENVNPYFPAGIFQIHGKEVHMIDELPMRNPNNTTTAMSRAIATKYRGHISGMRIFGDATSHKEDVKQEKGVDLFVLVMNGLQDFRPRRCVATSNPNVRARGDFMNDIFAGNPKVGGISIIIGEHCKEAINDFYLTKEAQDGGKDKKPIKDKNTGVSYQPHGHFGDLTEYLICFVFAAEFERYLRGNKGLQLTTGKYAPSKNSY